MKIVYLYSSLAIWGGVERVLVDKMNNLVSRGYEVHMITSDQGQHPVPYKLDERVHLCDLQIRLYSQYQFRGLRRLKESRKLTRLYFMRLKDILVKICPDLIVCTTSSDIYNLLRIKGDIPLVVEAHNNFSHIDTWWHHLLNRWNIYWIGKADAVVTLTQGDAKNWQRVSKHVYVIPNMVHLNDTGRNSDCVNKRAIFVGRLVEQKGIPDLIKVWQIVHQRYPNWQLDVFGNGDMDSIPDIKMFVHPPTSNIMEEYVNSSVLLMTSIFEPFGLVIPEAMSCGLPVVAFDCPYGPADIITHEFNGYLVSGRDVCQYADYVCQLIESPRLRHILGTAGVKTAQQYHANNIMPQWQRLFSDLMSKVSFEKNRQ